MNYRVEGGNLIVAAEQVCVTEEPDAYLREVQILADKHSPEAVLMDLAGVRNTPSAFIHALLGLQKILFNQDCPLVLYSLSEVLVDALAIAGHRDTFTIMASFEDALAYLADTATL